jgi:choline dehydrogenase
VFGVAALQLAPDARGSVTLRSADPFASPAIRLNLLETEQDRIFAREMFLFSRRFFAAEPLREFVATELFPGPDVSDVAAIDQFVKNTIITGAHGAGSCSMGVDPANSVVDAKLKVHGIEGLRVADASIMPTIVRGNTSAPSMMIGEKAADLILGRTAQSFSTSSGATGAAHSREQAA